MQVKEVTGRIMKQYGEQEAVSPAANILVYASKYPSEEFATRTDKNGFFILNVPIDETKISVVSPDLESGKQREDFTIQTNPNWSITLKLKYYGKTKNIYAPIILFILAIGAFIYIKRK
jgi:hypothetical protein